MYSFRYTCLWGQGYFSVVVWLSAMHVCQLQCSWSCTDQIPESLTSGSSLCSYCSFASRCGFNLCGSLCMDWLLVKALFFSSCRSGISDINRHLSVKMEMAVSEQLQSIGYSPTSLISLGYSQAKSEIKQRIYCSPTLSSTAKYHHFRNKTLELPNYLANLLTLKRRTDFTLVYFNALPSALLEGRYHNIHKRLCPCATLLWKLKHLDMYCCIAHFMITSDTLLFNHKIPGPLEEWYISFLVIWLHICDSAGLWL